MQNKTKQNKTKQEPKNWMLLQASFFPIIFIVFNASET